MKTEKEKEVVILTKLGQKDKERFKVLCIMKGISIQKQLEKLIQDFNSKNEHLFKN